MDILSRGGETKVNQRETLELEILVTKMEMNQRDVRADLNEQKNH